MAEIITAFGNLPPMTQCLGCLGTIVLGFFVLIFLEEVASAIFTIITNRK